MLGRNGRAHGCGSTLCLRNKNFLARFYVFLQLGKPIFDGLDFSRLGL
jgi:hypothetical protein